MTATLGCDPLREQGKAFDLRAAQVLCWCEWHLEELKFWQVIICWFCTTQYLYILLFVNSVCLSYRQSRLGNVIFAQATIALLRLQFVFTLSWFLPYGDKDKNDGHSYIIYYSQKQ